MIKTVIKIAISLAILVGCFNVGRALLAEYQFEDKVHDALLFDPRMSEKEIIDTVMTIAAEYEIPISPSEITSRQQGPDVHIDMSYTTDVVILPGIFSKSWTFTPSASTRILVGNRR